MVGRQDEKITNQFSERVSMNFGRVIIIEKDESRIRKKYGNLTFKVIDGNKELVFYTARTTVWEELRKWGTMWRSIGHESVKVKSYGKVRTQYVLRSKTIDENLLE